MTGKRKRYAAEFKAKVALEALRGELTTAQLATKHGVHQTMVSDWKRQAMEGLASLLLGQDGGERRSSGKERSRNCTRRSANWWWSGIFWPRPPVDEHGSEATIDRLLGHLGLSIVRQCELVSVSRSTFYREPVPETALNLTLMRLVDEQFLETPWYGSRQMMRYLRRQGHTVGRERVRRLMAKMGLAAIYQRPRTTIPHPRRTGFIRICSATW